MLLYKVMFENWALIGVKVEHDNQAPHYRNEGLT